MTVTLTITMDDAGNVGVSGPIENKVLSLGLLAVAHEAILEQGRKSANRLVTPATFAGLSNPIMPGS